MGSFGGGDGVCVCVCVCGLEGFVCEQRLEWKASGDPNGLGCWQCGAGRPPSAWVVVLWQASGSTGSIQDGLT